jgi:hypothetical protein
MARNQDHLPERDSSEDLTQTGIRAPTRVSLPPAAPVPSSFFNPELPFEAEAPLMAAKPVVEVEPEPEPDPWRDEVPTLVFEKPFNLERPAAAPDDSLSVVFKGARAPSTRPPPALPLLPATAQHSLPAQPLPAALPPPLAASERRSVQPLLPPPDEIAIPPAPRAPSEFLPPHYPTVPRASAPPASVDSLRPLAFDANGLIPVSLPWPVKPLHLLTAAILGAGALLGGFAWWQDQHGELVIDIADEQCGPVDNVLVYVDEELRCTSTPCTLTLRTGGHLVRAEVDGRTDAAARAVFVSSDVPALHKIQMGGDDKTAIEVRGGRPDSELYIDGRLEGSLPKRVTGLSSGEHLVELHDAKGVTVLERRVYLENDQLLVLDLALPPDQSASAEAPKEATGDDAEDKTERASRRESARGDSRASGAPAGEAALSSALGRTENEAEAKATTKAREPRAAAKATLNLSAEPSAMVLVDGRPLGHTPQRVTVDPGPHSLLFVHPIHGRSKASVNVQAGQTRNMHARFETKQEADE